MARKNGSQSSLIKCLKALFVRKRSLPMLQQAQAEANAHAQEEHSGEAFRAGAAVAFITPIGSYAGNAEQDAIRERAIQQFQQMQISHQTTIN